MIYVVMKREKENEDENNNKQIKVRE